MTDVMLQVQAPISVENPEDSEAAQSIECDGFFMKCVVCDKSVHEEAPIFMPCLHVMCKACSPETNDQAFVMRLCERCSQPFDMRDTLPAEVVDYILSANDRCIKRPSSKTASGEKCEVVASKDEAMCEIHGKPTVDRFCHSCGVAICVSCLDAHSSHNVIVLREEVKVTDEYEEVLKACESVRQSLRSDFQLLRENQLQLDRGLERATWGYDEALQEASEALQKHGKYLLHKVSDQILDKLSAFGDRKTLLEGELAEVHKTLLVAEYFKNNASPDTWARMEIAPIYFTKCLEKRKEVAAMLNSDFEKPMFKVVSDVQSIVIDLLEQLGSFNFFANGKRLTVFRTTPGGLYPQEIFERSLVEEQKDALSGKNDHLRDHISVQEFQRISSAGALKRSGSIAPLKVPDDVLIIDPAQPSGRSTVAIPAESIINSSQIVVGSPMTSGSKFRHILPSPASGVHLVSKSSNTPSRLANCSNVRIISPTRLTNGSCSQMVAGAKRRIISTSFAATQGYKVLKPRSVEASPVVDSSGTSTEKAEEPCESPLVGLVLKPAKELPALLPIPLENPTAEPMLIDLVDDDDHTSIPQLDECHICRKKIEDVQPIKCFVCSLAFHADCHVPKINSLLLSTFSAMVRVLRERKSLPCDEFFCDLCPVMVSWQDVNNLVSDDLSRVILKSCRAPKDCDAFLTFGVDDRTGIFPEAALQLIQRFSGTVNPEGLKLFAAKYNIKLVAESRKLPET
ncbi:unnamed protein product [Notodromas monacha]|uniref:Uncharacterized protein n=1 Tax=Notodromas monacha TaxID=399045 RepID=A0A7R9BDU5_9CRUS|nr:unnamed protein product [Notodromas monacha]CAG0913524.1 unnamed protein product [Notodromas monacha]